MVTNQLKNFVPVGTVNNWRKVKKAMDRILNLRKTYGVTIKPKTVIAPLTNHTNDTPKRVLAEN
jgi:hypothetical protein